MPRRRLHRLNRMIAGLLVVALLLFAGVQTAIAALPDSCHHQADVAGEVIAMVGDGAATPVHHNACDQGLLCCIGGQCSMHAYWIPETRAPLVLLSHVERAPVSGRERLLAGIPAEPSSPPPRAAV